MAVRKRLSILFVLLATLLAGCDHDTANDPAIEGKRQFSDYRVVEYQQKDPRKWNAKVRADFEKECGQLLRQGWSPVGGVSVQYSSEFGLKPFGYAQAFCR